MSSEYHMVINFGLPMEIVVFIRWFFDNADTIIHTATFTIFVLKIVSVVLDVFLLMAFYKR